MSIDGRYETAYPERVYRGYFDFLMGRKDWKNFPIAYPHDLALIRLKPLPCNESTPCRKHVYADFTGVVFVRNVDLKTKKNKQASRK